jgi:hypothetical protein
LLGSERLRAAIFRKIKIYYVQKNYELLCSGRLRAVVIKRVQSRCSQDGRELECSESEELVFSGSEEL